jgi:hypothetical protein
MSQEFWALEMARQPSATDQINSNARVDESGAALQIGILPGYRLGIIGGITLVHALYYARASGFGSASSLSWRVDWPTSATV